MRKRAIKLLSQLGGGRLTVVEGEKRLLTGAADGAILHVHDSRAWWALSGGSVTAARAYIEGWWSSPDLYALMRLAARNLDALNATMDSGWRQLPGLLLEALRQGHRRLFSRRRARSDIVAHYDLGNDFFSLFLDETLAYSCAVFPDIEAAGSDTLPAASRHKLEKISDKLELTAGDHLLDLGCGWGSMTFHAADRRGCRVTGVTLSPAQHRFVKAEIARHRLGEGASVVLSDYRDFNSREKFGKISSVEMIEAVGERHFSTYFQRIRHWLRPEGLAQVQAIVIPHGRYHSARREADFIRQYVFPGGMLPSLEIIRQSATAAGLRLVGIEDIGAHYAPTLMAWRQRFCERQSRVRALGFDNRFCRLWDYYFCYCAGAFAEKKLSVAQLLFSPAPSS